MSEREPGFYWVKLKWQEHNGHVSYETAVAEWHPQWGWLSTGSEMGWLPGDVEALSERLLPPDWDKGPPIKSEE